MDVDFWDTSKLFIYGSSTNFRIDVVKFNNSEFGFFFSPIRNVKIIHPPPTVNIYEHRTMVEVYDLRKCISYIAFYIADENVSASTSKTSSTTKEKLSDRSHCETMIQHM